MIRYHPEVEEMFSRNKYHNKKLDTDDGKFDSKYEYQKWCELKLLEKNGNISDLHRQVKFELIPSIKTACETLRSISYYADFVYIEGGTMFVVDSKGYNTDVFQIKKRLLIQKIKQGIEFNGKLIPALFVETKKGKPDKIYK